jgi:hypothetical protein
MDEVYMQTRNLLSINVEGSKSCILQPRGMIYAKNVN